MNIPKMNNKKLLVSLVILTSLLVLAAGVNAASFSSVSVTVNDVNAQNNPAVSVGQTLTVKVYFNSMVNSSDVKVQAELMGQKIDVTQVTSPFQVESGNTYEEVLTLKVPNELQNAVSDSANLNIDIWGGSSTEYSVAFPVRVQRQSYDVSLMSVDTLSTVSAGQLFPVNIVMENTGYNKLNDLFVTLTIPELGITKTAFFGNLVPLTDNNNQDITTSSGTVYLQAPFSAKAGVYTLNVDVKNRDLELQGVKSIQIKNDFNGNYLFVSGNQLNVVNPTNNLIVFNLVPQSGSASVSLSDSIVSVPAGSSKTITMSPSGNGNYTINAYTMSGDLVDSVKGNANGSQSGNAINVLAVILTIVFIVLLVTLIVLVTRKPKKTEEFGESYY